MSRPIYKSQEQRCVEASAPMPSEASSAWSAAFVAALNTPFAIEIFETEIDDHEIEFDVDGPALTSCEYCGTLTQFWDDHECGGTRSEAGEARDFEERAHGWPNE